MVGDNKPYSMVEPYGYTIHLHGENNNLPCVGIEVRQDLIDTHHGAESWANILADAIGHDRILPNLRIAADEVLARFPELAGSTDESG